MKGSRPPGTRRVEPDALFYGAHDFAELVYADVLVGTKQHLSAVRRVRQERPRFDLERHLVEGVDILEDDFEVDMKIAGQFIRPEDLQGRIVGPRCGEVECV